MNDPAWYVAIQAAAAVSTTIGVLIALYIAVVSEPRKAKEERKQNEAQINALNRAENDRVAAQARKVVPSCVRTPMFGNKWWTVKIENISNSAATILDVDVTALDSGGSAIVGGCQQANNSMAADQAFEKSIRAALAGSLEGGLQRSGYGAFIPPGTSSQLASQMVPRVQKAMQEAMIGHFATEWQKTLGPNQSAIMAYSTAAPDYELTITVEFEDEAGYRWRRTDSGQPERLTARQDR